MKITVKIMNKEDGLGWSKPIDIEDFIVYPYDIEFEWADGSVLPYKDFIFYRGDYYYRIFINDKNINDYEEELKWKMKIKL